MKALFRCEKNWQKINVQRFSANFLFSKNGKCRSITYSGDFATLPVFCLTVIEHPLIALQRCISLRCHTSCKESATPAEEIPELSAGQAEW